MEPTVNTVVTAAVITAIKSTEQLVSSVRKQTDCHCVNYKRVLNKKYGCVSVLTSDLLLIDQR